MSDLRTSVQDLSQQYRHSSKPLGWFEDLYATAAGNPDAIPWARLTAHQCFQDWLEQTHLVGQDRSALVVGSGLGDDAEALSQCGFQVTAFDLSATATSWSQQRFPESTVQYQTANLFDPPAAWRTGFEFVLEIYTIQAMPPELHSRAIRAISDLVAPGGQLLVICRGREEAEPAMGPPFALSRSELSEFETLGLKVVQWDDIAQSEAMSLHFRVLYQRG